MAENKIKNTPEQQRIRQVLAEMPYGGTAGFAFTDEMDYKNILFNLEKLKTTLEFFSNRAQQNQHRLAEIDHMHSEVGKFFRIITREPLIGGTIHETVVEFLKEKRLIDAIKYVRAVTGKGLKEAKEYVDSVRDSIAVQA